MQIDIVDVTNAYAARSRISIRERGLSRNIPRFTSDMNRDRFKLYRAVCLKTDNIVF